MSYFPEGESQDEKRLLASRRRSSVEKGMVVNPLRNQESL
jgi:hypothetical protein